MDAILALVTFAVLLGLGYGVGRARERSHLASLVERERGIEPAVGVCSNRRVAGVATGQCIGLVTGEAVIATDYFKVVVASLRNLFGGEVRGLETLMDRARREAAVRMLESARDLGADAVINLRFATSTVGGQSQDRNQQQVGGVEVVAYGTAVRLGS